MRIARPQSAQVAMSQFPCELESTKFSRKQIAIQKMENSLSVKIETQKSKESTINQPNTVLSSSRKNIRQILDAGVGYNYKNSELSQSTTSFPTCSQSFSQALHSFERHQSAASFQRINKQVKEQQGNISLSCLAKDKQGDNREEQNELTKANGENITLRMKLQKENSRERQFRKIIKEKEECERQIGETRQQIVQVEKKIKEIIQKLRESEKMRNDSQKQAELSINLKNELEQADLKRNIRDKLIQTKSEKEVEKVITQETLRLQKENKLLNQRMSKTEREYQALKEDYTLMIDLNCQFEGEQLENEQLQVKLVSLVEKLEEYQLANEKSQVISQKEFQLIGNKNTECKTKLQDIQEENKRLMNLLAEAQANCDDVYTASMEGSLSSKLFRLKKNKTKQINSERRSQESLFPQWMQEQQQSNNKQPLNKMSQDSQLQNIKNYGRKATVLKKSKSSSSNNQSNSTLQLIHGNNTPNNVGKNDSQIKPLPETTAATPMNKKQPSRTQFFILKTSTDSSKLDITSNSKDLKEDDSAKKQDISSSLTLNLLVNSKNKNRKLITATSLQNFYQEKNQQQEEEENHVKQDKNPNTNKQKLFEGLAKIVECIDSEREAFVTYCMSKVDFETKTEQYEKMIQKQEYLVFPNPCNLYIPIVLSAPLHQIAQQLFCFDYKLYQTDLKKLRIQSSLKIQEQILDKLYSNYNNPKDIISRSDRGITLNSSFSSNNQFAQTRQKIHNFKEEYNSLPLSQVLQDPEILRMLSFNPTSIPLHIISQIQLTSMPQNLGEGKCYRGVLSLTNQRCSLIEYPIISIQQLKPILKSQQIISLIASSFILKPIFTYIQSNQNSNHFQMNAIYSPLLMTLTSFLNSFSVTVSARLKICLGISLGLFDLHRHFFIHTKISTDTIILNETLLPLIAGFQETKNESQQAGQLDYSIDLIALGNTFKRVLLENSKGGYPSAVQEKQIKEIINTCNRSNESVENIIMKLQELLAEEDLQEIKRIQSQLFKLPKNENNEEHEQEQLNNPNINDDEEHTLFESARLYTSRNIQEKQKQNTSIDDFKLGRLFRASPTEEQLECTLGIFQNEQILGGSMLIRQGEDSIQYMRSENDGNLYVDEGINAQELVRCSLLNGLPIISRELENEFIEAITEECHIQNNSISSSISNIIKFDGFESKECFVDSRKRKVKIIDNKNGSEIEYSPLKIRSRRHPNDAWLVETGRSCSLKMVDCAVSVTLPNLNSKERFNASSSNYYCELVNINPTYLLMLASKHSRKDNDIGNQPSREIDTTRETSSVAVMFDSQFGLTTFQPKKNVILISDIIIKGGCLGLVIDAQNSQVFFGLFVSPENPLMINGFRITQDQLIPIQNYNLKEFAQNLQ